MTLTWTQIHADLQTADQDDRLGILRNTTSRRFALHLRNERTTAIDDGKVVFKGSLARCKEVAEDYCNDPPTSPLPTEDIPTTTTAPTTADYENYQTLTDESWESAKAHAPALEVAYHALSIERAEILALHVADQGETYGRTALHLVGKSMARAVRKALRRFGYFRLAGMKAA